MLSLSAPVKAAGGIGLAIGASTLSLARVCPVLSAVRSERQPLSETEGSDEKALRARILLVDGALLQCHLAVERLQHAAERDEPMNSGDLANRLLGQLVALSALEQRLTGRAQQLLNGESETDSVENLEEALGELADDLSRLATRARSAARRFAR